MAARGAKPRLVPRTSPAGQRSVALAKLESLAKPVVPVLRAPAPAPKERAGGRGR